MPVPTGQPTRYLNNEMMLSATRIRSIAVFFTAVLTAAVLVSGFIGAAVIFRDGNQNAVDCPSNPTPSPSNHLDNDLVSL